MAKIIIEKKTFSPIIDTQRSVFFESLKLKEKNGTYELSYEGSSPYTLVTKGGEVIGEHVEGYMDESQIESFLSDLGL